MQRIQDVKNRHLLLPLVILLALTNGAVGGELYDSALGGKEDDVVRLLESGLGNVNETGDLGTPLHAAASQGNVNIIKLLLDKGADIESAANAKGERPLFVAVTYHQAEAVRLLLQRGADVDARSGTGLTPLHRSVRLGLAEVAAILIDNGADIEAPLGKLQVRPLHMASWYDRYDAVKLLLERHANLEAVMTDGTTPLLAAAENGSPKLIELLLFHGAEVKVQLEDGSTPMVLAKRNLFADEVAKVLTNHGAK